MIGLVLVLAAPTCRAGDDRLDFSLPLPKDNKDLSYLGLAKSQSSGTDEFTLGQIDARVVIVQVFSMYCPICQREADDVNAMFDLIKKNPSYKSFVKLIGIGAGNSSFEVDFYKDKYKVQFPLFSDGSYEIHKQINEVRTPHFFGLLLEENKPFKVFYSQSGEIADPKEFLDMLLEKSGMGR